MKPEHTTDFYNRARLFYVIAIVAGVLTSEILITDLFVERNHDSRGFYLFAVIFWAAMIWVTYTLFSKERTKHLSSLLKRESAFDQHAIGSLSCALTYIDYALGAKEGLSEGMAPLLANCITYITRHLEEFRLSDRDAVVIEVASKSIPKAGADPGDLKAFRSMVVTARDAYKDILRDFHRRVYDPLVQAYIK